MLITGVGSSPGCKMVISLANRYEVVGTYNEHPISMPGVITVKANLTRGSARLINGYKTGCCRSHGYHAVVSRELLTAAYRVGSAIYYLSTDYVFDGERGMYTEKGALRPVNYYGLTKLLAEEIKKALGGSIVRVAAYTAQGLAESTSARPWLTSSWGVRP